MNPTIVRGVIECQRKIFEQTNRRTDAHYQEGQGALFVFEGQELKPQNVIYAADEMVLTMAGLRL